MPDPTELNPFRSPSTDTVPAVVARISIFSLTLFALLRGAGTCVLVGSYCALCRGMNYSSEGYAMLLAILVCLLMLHVVEWHYRQDRWITFSLGFFSYAISASTMILFDYWVVIS